MKYYCNYKAFLLLIFIFTFESCDVKKNCNYIPIKNVDYSTDELSDIFSFNQNDTLKLLRNNNEVYFFVAENISTNNYVGTRSDGKGCDSVIKYFNYSQTFKDNVHLKPLSIAVDPTYGNVFHVFFDDLNFEYMYKNTIPFIDTVNTQFGFYDNILAIRNPSNNKQLYLKKGYGIVKIYDKWGNIFERIP